MGYLWLWGNIASLGYPTEIGQNRFIGVSNRDGAVKDYWGNMQKLGNICSGYPMEMKQCTVCSVENPSIRQYKFTSISWKWGSKSSTEYPTEKGQPI